MSQAIIFIGGASAVLAFVLVIVVGITARVGGEELSGWMPIWARGLLGTAVKQLPVAQQQRYREEWRAEISAFQGRPIAALLFAFRLRWRAKSVSEAILDERDLGEFPEVNPFPNLRPLTPEAIAEIVRRVVERSRPNDLRSARQIIDSVRTSLSELRLENDLSILLARYLRDVDPAWPGLLRQRQIREADDYGFDEIDLAGELERMLRWAERERRRRYRP